MERGLDLFSSAGVGTDRTFSVADITRRARQLIDAGFEQVWIRGEVTGFKASRVGHWYFTLRDAEAQVRCVMWRTDNERLPTPPNEGAQVFVMARPTMWEERGEFRLTVRRFVPTEDGGEWQRRLEHARQALKRDGLLDPARKRALPPYPHRVAVVTSLDGAALRDIVAVFGRRWPLARLLVVPARVQGERAEHELCLALSRVNRIPKLDLVIVGRGGGSREDLWAFNDERVARAVAAVTVPTVSAVGHESDISLTDLVADVRAATPSAAAEAAVPDVAVVQGALGHLAKRLGRGLTQYTRIGDQRLTRTADRLVNSVLSHLTQCDAQVSGLGQRLHALSPLSVLRRGFAVARNDAGRILKRVDDFAPADEFRLTVSDGDVRARVLGGRT